MSLASHEIILQIILFQVQLEKKKKIALKIQTDGVVFYSPWQLKLTEVSQKAWEFSLYQISFNLLYVLP